MRPGSHWLRKEYISRLRNLARRDSIGCDAEETSTDNWYQENSGKMLFEMSFMHQK